jgi:hypothetical protein
MRRTRFLPLSQATSWTYKIWLSIISLLFYQLLLPLTWPDFHFPTLKAPHGARMYLYLDSTRKALIDDIFGWIHSTDQSKSAQIFWLCCVAGAGKSELFCVACRIDNAWHIRGGGSISRRDDYIACHHTYHCAILWQPRATRIVIFLSDRRTPQKVLSHAISWI